MERIIAHKDFWDKPEEAKPILKERTLIGQAVDKFKGIYHDLEETELLLELALEESDSDTLEEVSQQVRIIEKGVQKLSL
ncbi:MAG: peptide chain release factor 2, partial [Desulfobacterales bacterium]